MAVVPGGAEDPASRIEALVSKEERAIRAAFREAVAAIRDQFTLEELADLLAQGRVAEALASVEAAGAIIAGQSNAVFVEAAKQAQAFLNGALTTTIAFDQVNVRAVNIMQQNRLQFVQEFSAEQRRATRAAITEGTREGVNPREMARRFRGSIGLTERQEQAVSNYRRLLREGSSEANRRRLRDKRFDSTVRRAARGEIKLTEEQIDKMVGRYREKYLRYRSEVIARTEALRAVNQGTEEMYQQAFDSGELDPQEVTRKWITAQDERVRSSHSLLHGTTRKPNEPFETGLASLMHPGDPAAPPEETVQCRCALSTRLDSL